MNLKQRLTSTENLLRSIRGGEVPASRTLERAEPGNSEKTSIWTRRVSFGDAFSGLARRSKAAPPPATPNEAETFAAAFQKPATKLFWNRQISFGRGGKPLAIGVNVSGLMLCIAVVRASSGAIAAARRFPMEPDQAPGEKRFAVLLRESLATMGFADADADIWAVLRSPDLDLNVLSVPRLSGAKLDAAVYWTLQKEKKFAEAEYVLDYLVSGPTAASKDPKLDVLTCLARRADVERLRESFREAGYALAGITAIPNAFLGLYRRRGAPAGYALAANIHVEPDFSAIGLYTKDRLLFSRFIRSGAGSMAEALADHFQEQAMPRPDALDDMELPLPGAASPGPKPAPEPAAPPLNAEQAQALLRHVLLGAPKPAFATQAHLLSPAQMIDIIAPAIERLARQVERTLDYYAGSQQLRCDALHLSGEIFASEGITQALAGQLGFPAVVFDATRIVGDGADLVAPNERMAMAPALAAALSPPGKGVNLLANYKGRTAEEAKRTVTRFLLLGLAALMVLIGCAGIVIERATAVKREELAGLRTRLAAMGPPLDEQVLQNTVTKYKTRQDSLREAANRLLAPAALAEIANRAPVAVRILNFTAEYPVPEPAKADQQPPPPGHTQPGQPATAAPGFGGVITVEGIVTGERAEFDATLSRFILALQASPMFTMPLVNESGLKDLDSGGQVLHFVMRLGVK